MMVPSDAQQINEGEDVGFIGLGNMGFRMAGNIRKRMPTSATLYVFDIVPAACERFFNSFSSFGPIEIAQTAKDAAETSGTVISMVPTGENAKEVYLNPVHGVIAAQKLRDRLILECSTIDVKSTTEIGKTIVDAGAGRYVDAPVSGGTKGAEAANLSFMVGFDAARRSEPLGQQIEEVIHRMGAPERLKFCGGLGMGLVCKTVNNYIGLSNLVTAAEGMAFGLKHGVDKMTLYKCIKGSSGDSWVMDGAQLVPGIHAASPSTQGFRASFAPRLCVKDVSLALQAAQESGIEGSMGTAALKIFQKTDDDPRTTNLDCSAVWLHIAHELEGIENGIVASEGAYMS